MNEIQTQNLIISFDLCRRLDNDLHYQIIREIADVNREIAATYEEADPFPANHGMEIEPEMDDYEIDQRMYDSLRRGEA